MKTSTHKQIWITTALILVLIAAGGLADPQTLQGAFRLASGNIYRILTQPYFHLGPLPVTLGFLLKVFAFFLALGFFSRLCQQFLQKEVFAFALPGTKGSNMRFPGCLDI